MTSPDACSRYSCSNNAFAGETVAPPKCELDKQHVLRKMLRKGSVLLRNSHSLNNPFKDDERAPTQEQSYKSCKFHCS